MNNAWDNENKQMNSSITQERVPKFASSPWCMILFINYLDALALKQSYRSMPHLCRPGST